MNTKRDGTVHNAINRLRIQGVNRQIEVLRNAVYHITQQMMTINSQDMDTNRIQDIRLFLIIH